MHSLRPYKSILISSHLTDWYESAGTCVLLAADDVCLSKNQQIASSTADNWSSVVDSGCRPSPAQITVTPVDVVQTRSPTGLRLPRTRPGAPSIAAAAVRRYRTNFIIVCGAHLSKCSREALSNCEWKCLASPCAFIHEMSAVRVYYTHWLKSTSLHCTGYRRASVLQKRVLFYHQLSEVVNFYRRRFVCTSLRYFRNHWHKTLFLVCVYIFRNERQVHIGLSSFTGS